MARQRYDIGSKWLLQNQGKGTLRIGGLRNVHRTESMPAEVVQNRRLPDGLLRAFLTNDPVPHHVLIEIATRPERRALKQAMDDLTLAYSALGHLPDLLMLVLRPKGRFRIAGNHAIQSSLGLSRMDVAWKVVELWTLSAADFLDEEVGILPWVPLMRMNGPVEPVLQRCAERIEREAPPAQRDDMLVVSEVMTQLVFPESALWNIFRGAHAMIESPLIQQWKSEGLHEAVLAILKKRFGTVGREVTKAIRRIHDDRKMIALAVVAADCPDLAAFRKALKP